MFKLKKLSERAENSNICFNCEGSLEDYILSLPGEYQNYDIQRGVVTNAYLDNLTRTILSNEFIPHIVLIADTLSQEIDAGECPESHVVIADGYKILDGLQRTVRMKAIYDAFQLYLLLIERDSKETIDALSKYHLKKGYEKDISTADIDISYLWSIIQFYKEKKHTDINESIFKDFKQWFIIWDHLEKPEQINKMLVLNAGHKSMDLKHQLELLFLNLLSDNYLVQTFLSGDDQIKKFVRAKDTNAAYFYKVKEVGQLHLSHFISALIAFEKAVPFTLNQQHLQNIQESLDFDIDIENLKLFFDQSNVDHIVHFIERLDSLFSVHYSSQRIGIEWLGRESIMIGLFAAFGKYYSQQKQHDVSITLATCFDNIFRILETKVDAFKLANFNEAKTSIDITKQNIGNVFKFTTYYATYKLLSEQIDSIDWPLFFEKYGKKVDNECN